MENTEGQLGAVGGMRVSLFQGSTEDGTARDGEWCKFSGQAYFSEISRISHYISIT